MQAILRAIFGYFMAIPLEKIPRLDIPLHTLIGALYSSGLLYRVVLYCLAVAPLAASPGIACKYLTSQHMPVEVQTEPYGFPVAARLAACCIPCMPHTHQDKSPFELLRPELQPRPEATMEVSSLTVPSIWLCCDSKAAVCPTMLVTCIACFKLPLSYSTMFALLFWSCRAAAAARWNHGGFFPWLAFGHATCCLLHAVHASSKLILTRLFMKCIGQHCSHGHDGTIEVLVPDSPCHWLCYDLRQPSAPPCL
jgi:hypothetical protein